MKIILVNEEKRLLLDKLALPKNLRVLIPNDSENSEMDISEDDSSDFWERCADALDLIGFDANGETTKEGLILEGLIDKFYID